MRSRVRCTACVVLAATLLLAGPALALTVEVAPPLPSLVGEAQTFSAMVTDAEGEVSFEWRFGEAGMFEPGASEATFTFDTPGLHSVDVVATDAAGNVGSWYLRHLVHYPLTAQRPTSSSSIVFDAVRNRVYTVNQDNDTITSIDATTLTKVAELAVYDRPEALALTPDGKLWVVHQDDYAVAVVSLDQFVVETGFRLPYASQPIGVAMSPTGNAAYVTLMALGRLLALDPSTGSVLGEVDVGPRPRGVAVSHDGADVYVTRFISPDEGGEVVKVDAASLTVSKRILLRLDTESDDSDQEARGLPNYLFSVALTPDGRQGWVPGKKDNIVRGLLRDGLELTHDTTVRPLTSIFDTEAAEEIYENRVDLDDRSMPVHVEFTPYGNFAILTLAGSNRLEVRDVNRPTQVFSAIANVGAFPRASVLTPSGLLFVQAALTRNVLVYDMAALLEDFDQSTPPQVADIKVVSNDQMPADVLLGKKLFHNADDTRMAFEGYITCGGCHFEGIDDGRVYDFSTRGEGFRNTLSLIGTGQGRLNWTGNLDEVQDFEHQIRDLFDGLGFIPDDVLATQTYADPFGDSKAGLSAELDALDAYVRSLNRVNPSPYRNPDGSLTEAALSGRALFEKLGCNVCHSGPAFTDSESGALHDVGTITSQSGTRMGELLYGLDTPTLLGVWETPPYLHDGSAATVRDVLTTRNPTDLHGFVSVLSSEQVDQLVAYVMQIDGELPFRPLPFEPEEVPVRPAATAVPPPVIAPFASPVTPAGPWSPVAMPIGSSGAAEPEQEGAGGSGCSVPAHGVARSNPWELFLVVGLFGGALLRRGTRGRWRGPLAMLCVGSIALGCGTPEPRDDAPVEQPPDALDWSTLPAVVDADPELTTLGTREETYQRLCARGRTDSFAMALCGSGQRPSLPNLGALLDLVGLGESRAFALTGNSTSLVSNRVSALNPRIIVFPRVASDLQRPETMTALGFVRGEQFVEIVSRDLVTDDFNFYLVAFEQRCNYEGSGCDLTSLLTEAIEHDWTAYSVYDHDDLEPTSFDCQSCHRMGPPGTRRILRMQELTGPWLHWFPQRFGQRTDSDRVLGAQFAETHGVDAQYGGIPVATIVGAIDEGSGAQLETLVRAEGSGEQPNPFDGRITVELAAGSSPTWEDRFRAHLRGEAIAVPYPLIDVTDATKRAAAMRSYLDVVGGLAPRESLLDIRDVFSGDAAEKLSFVPPRGADGKTVLLQMCARCHDGRANPETPKGRFNVLLLDEMSRQQKDLVIARINAQDDTRMPPWRVGNLTPESLEAATLELQK